MVIITIWCGQIITNQYVFLFPGIKLSTGTIIGISCAAVFVIFTMVVSLVLYIRRRRGNHGNGPSAERDSLDSVYEAIRDLDSGGGRSFPEPPPPYTFSDDGDGGPLSLPQRAFSGHTGQPPPYCESSTSTVTQGDSSGGHTRVDLTISLYHPNDPPPSYEIAIVSRSHRGSGNESVGESVTSQRQPEAERVQSISRRGGRTSRSSGDRGRSGTAERQHDRNIQVNPEYQRPASEPGNVRAGGRKTRKPRQTTPEDLQRLKSLLQGANLTGPRSSGRVTSPRQQARGPTRQQPEHVSAAVNNGDPNDSDQTGFLTSSDVTAAGVSGTQSSTSKPGTREQTRHAETMTTPHRKKEQRNNSDNSSRDPQDQPGTSRVRSPNPVPLTTNRPIRQQPVRRSEAGNDVTGNDIRPGSRLSSSSTLTSRETEV